MNPFYRVVRAIMRFVLKLYFKKVKLAGFEQLRKDKAMILAVNHPNSFLEAMVLACWLPIPLHFIVRGDVFHPKFRWFFKWTNQIPIFRPRDGFSKMKQNQESFRHCYEKLNEGAKIIIFPEGTTQWIKQLRPLKKGVARLLMSTMERYSDLDIDIVPIGVNFEDVFALRSSVHIFCGKVVSARGFFAKERPVEAIMGYIKNELEQVVVHIENPSITTQFDALAEWRGYFDHQEISGNASLVKFAKEFNQRNDLKLQAEKLQEVKQLYGDVDLYHVRHLNNYPSRFDLVLAWIARSVHFLFVGWMLYLSRYIAHKILKSPVYQIPLQLGICGVFVLTICICALTLAIVFKSFSILILLAMYFLFAFRVANWIDFFKKIKDGDVLKKKKFDVNSLNVYQKLG